ncbi:hypothetical protein [Comamonas endophytica]|uniref:DUF697 domain-containing protein n=1 Tax=Comamonas endophytica TaxID=2949090 RepID=A0ABY6G976_9BURK|nr:MULTISPECIES: hypothetical protein [unclassified Acidovorax]MCD2511857.1 hypothetical protein [Acidovorax sp. D4N7]UYG51579.1 hypothetical protein M9799_16240 [Acidovorax sp. 5MLIR]
MSASTEFADAMPPGRQSQIDAAAERARKLLHRRAIAGAVASSLPIPGLDWAVDAALLARLIPRISQEFGLSAEQIDALEPSRREGVQKAVAVVGSVLIGKLVTREMVVRMVQKVAMRMAAKRLGKFVPIVGTAVAAAMGYAALRFLGEQHIRDCIRVAQSADVDMPVGSSARADQLLAKARRAARRNMHGGG